MLIWLIAVLAGAALAMAVWRGVRRAATRSAVRSVRRFRARVDRFKLTSKRYITTALLGDERISEAVREHATAHRLDARAVWRRVEEYIDEIVPFFNLVAYYRFGYEASRVVLNAVYRVSVEFERPRAFDALPRESIVVYLFNHRSNADYVLAAYALAGEVSISYAVGEWARVFPLEYIFKSFGSYFVRRRYREPLYHAVLERYVQLITRNGVTQGIFPEGGLSRNGRLGPAKIGLLDYVLGVAREPGFRERLYIVPVGINYDRVIEDRSLLRELRVREGGQRESRLVQMREVAHFALWNSARLVFRRWKRYGVAAATIGEPVALAPWFAAQESDGVSLFDLPRQERLGRVQAMADAMMLRIGALVPVTPVALVCAAIQSVPADFIRRQRLLERMAEMREVLVELNARLLRADPDVADTLDRAYALLRMRRAVVRDGDGYLVLPHGRELISYYANSVAHLLGDFESGVRARDALAAVEGSAALARAVV